MRGRHHSKEDGRAAATAEQPLVAVGLGGRLELTDGSLRIVKGGVIGHLVTFLWLQHGMMEKRIALASVTSVEIVTPTFLPDFIRVTYAGSPPQTGRYLADSLAENALVMNVVDNRAFHEIAKRIEQAIAIPVRSGTSKT
ncbi:MAG: hypothetical protein EXQ85_08725 [Alphaproteobacteria bacterium]|nr:hypothetical protein [Alphaproteobacteria bacterium]